MQISKERGNKDFPIWFIGDSQPTLEFNPKKKSLSVYLQELSTYLDFIDYPLTTKHPTIHNIWTSIENELQEFFFRSFKKRLDSKKIYVRNAVRLARIKPKGSSVNWNGQYDKLLNSFNSDIKKYQPRVLITFGQFAYEFVRRSRNMKKVKIKDWTVIELGNEFRKAMTNPNSGNLYMIPLLHEIVANQPMYTQNFVDQQNVSKSYFEYVAQELGLLIVNLFQKQGEIWI